MTSAADLVARGGEVHTMRGETASALAVRDGELVHVGSGYEARFLAGVETTELHLDGRVVLPGFVDAHTHLRIAGWREARVDLGSAESVDEVAAALRAADPGPEGWVLGWGLDDGDWNERLTGDALPEGVPVAAFREDLHGAVVNAAARERVTVPADAVGEAAGEPSGTVVGEARANVFRAIDPGRAGTRDLLLAAARRAARVGVTSAHDFARFSRAPAAYRDLARDGELPMRVRLYYWADHLDAVVEAGLHTNHGVGRFRVGGVKCYTDGSLGSHTARLREPYADADTRGEWLRDPDSLRDLVTRADGEGYQLVAHAVGDEAVESVLDAYGGTDPAAARHRIEHATLATDDQIARAAESGVVACLQPNYRRWAGPDGLYERRLGERAARTNRVVAWAESGATVAFGSDCMPLDPLYGVGHAVDAGLDVSEALRAYTRGSARAGFDEERVGVLTEGAAGDFVVLDASPWETHPGDVGVALTVVGGEVVYDDR